MARKRKRSRPSTQDNAAYPRKSVKPNIEQKAVQHPTLCLYYTHVSTLRHSVLSRLPPSSRTRRRKIVSANNGFLDSTLVCMVDVQRSRSNSSRSKDFEAFSQRFNLTAGSSIGEGSTSQSDLIDFAVWLLFHRVHQQAHRPPHMLCHGYQRASNPRRRNEDHCALAGIPGLVSHYPNENVDALKNGAWTGLLDSLGKEGDRIMLDLILECALFVAVDGGRGNFYQLSGTPMTELPPLAVSKNIASSGACMLQQIDSRSSSKPASIPQINSPAAINFVRNRMFYARAALNAKGKVTFGLRHIHVLNRYPDTNSPGHTVHIMKYIFPRQFGLHNAFNSSVDPKETVQPLKDYTLREQEIAQIQRRALQGKGIEDAGPLSSKHHVPKRLRGATFDLVRKLQKSHSRCSYYQLLKHYCPLRRKDRPHRRSKPMKSTPTQVDTQVSRQSASSNAVIISSRTSAGPQKPYFVTLATPYSDVSTFCRAALSTVIPDGFWGEGIDGKSNKTIAMQHVDRFIRLRRFESMSLHVVSQRIKLVSMAWLIPTHISPSAKIAASDMQKRKEIFQEFLYYVFDSLLMPLIRSNFHVTESNVHQNRLFFFRHDVWRSLAEPAMSNLKLSMFEEIKTLKARKMLDARSLGFSQIRLLPKATGVRPITNLRRRVTKLDNGKVNLGRSINSIMAPVFNILDYEKRKQPTLVGSALSSVGEMYPKLKSYARMLRERGMTREPLYFAKADVKSCFDTIRQQAVVTLMKKIIAEDEYRIARHAEIKTSDTRTYGKSDSSHSKPARKFVSTARAAADFPEFDLVVAAELAMTKKNTVFVDSIVQTAQGKKRMLDLLEDHVERNVIKIGKKFFRQKAGIPQGSVLSSLLCNYFYAELERECFGFLQNEESILLRLIDDFLLITTNRIHAQEFLQVMYNGVERYGVEVNPAKSLANFETSINGIQVPQLHGRKAFPYCGNMIDTRTLEITKDRDRRKGTVLADTLTVERSKIPGKTFYRKALSAFKIQTHKMFLDTTFNSPNTVLSTIHQNFLEASMKYYRYAKCMGSNEQPHLDLLIGTISDLVDLAFVLIKGKHKAYAIHDYSCAVSKPQVQWLATKAFRSVLGRKQSKYREVIAWLDVAIAESAPNNGKEASRLNRVAKQGESVFRGYQF